MRFKNTHLYTPADLQEYYAYKASIRKSYRKLVKIYKQGMWMNFAFAVTQLYMFGGSVSAGRGPKPIPVMFFIYFTAYMLRDKRSIARTYEEYYEYFGEEFTENDDDLQELLSFPNGAGDVGSEGREAVANG